MIILFGFELESKSIGVLNDKLSESEYYLHILLLFLFSRVINNVWYRYRIETRLIDDRSHSISKERLVNLINTNTTRLTAR